MARTFTHDLAGAQAIGGSFELHEELRLTVAGREALVLLGAALVDTACCGVGGCRYAVVPGWILRYRAETDADGVDVSEVEPVVGETEKRLVRQALTAREHLDQVVFW